MCVPGPFQSGSGEVFAFISKKLIIHVEGGFFQQFVLDGDLDLQTLVTILLGGDIGPQKTFMVIESALRLSVGQFFLHTMPSFKYRMSCCD